jgi:hypothetical protein
MLWLLLLLVFYSSFTNAWADHHTEFVKTSPTVFGPSGLLFTQSADTLAPGKIEIGTSFSYERSDRPDITLNELLPTVTIGLLDRLELSARADYLFVNVVGQEERTLQDVDISLKWRFIDENKKDKLPAAGLSFTYFKPTGKDELRQFGSWGLKALIVSSAEAELGKPYGILVGLYFNGGIMISDLGKSYEERHTLIDFGTLFPLTESRQLQLLLELNITNQNDTPFEGDYTGVTAALRYVNAHLNVTGGIQTRIRSATNVDDTNRFIVQGSVLF